MKYLKTMILSIVLGLAVGCEIYNTNESLEESDVSVKDSVNVVEEKSKEISEDEAISIAKEYFLKNCIQCESKVIEVDHVEENDYIIHIYEIVGKGEEYEHSATLGWFKVNKYTGNISNNN